jgi:hypothetical protein
MLQEPRILRDRSSRTPTRTPTQRSQSKNKPSDKLPPINPDRVEVENKVPEDGRLLHILAQIEQEQEGLFQCKLRQF